MVLSANHQINFVKDQQDNITTKLNAEYMALEEEIMGLDLEVRFSGILLLFQRFLHFSLKCDSLCSLCYQSEYIILCTESQR